MTYQQAIDFLFDQLATYQTDGAKALNKSLNKTILLLEYFGNPQNNFKSIHVAGTNGKGSSCHMISSVLQESGYNVGLYSSPHLKSFTERIKINGVEVGEQFVANFVDNNKEVIKELKPSFFEMTTAMSFLYFSEQNVDFAIIETGLGGRLDSTNVLNPLVSLITNISLDHQSILGNTLGEIAEEKAGIIKIETPVVIGKTQNESQLIFTKRAKELDSEIVFADSIYKELDQFTLDLRGNYQKGNLPGVLCIFDELTKLGFSISNYDINVGLTSVVKNTNLKGRWQTLSNEPLIICDTGHNEDGIKAIVKQIIDSSYNKLFMIIGMVNDKDVNSILSLFPKEAEYVFVQPDNNRAMEAEKLVEIGMKHGLNGVEIKDVNQAIRYSVKKASKNDLIFVGGSTFVVAEIDDL